MRLLGLPDEVIHSILTETSGQDVARCLQTCRRLRDLVERSSALRYLVELFASSMEDVPRHKSLQKVRLKRLVDSEKAWVSPSLSSVGEYPFQDAEDWVITSDLLVIINDANYQELTFQTLSSVHAGRLPDRWSISLPAPSESFVADPYQNLLAAVTFSPTFGRSYMLALYTLTEGKPHPLAYSTGLIPFVAPEEEGNEVSIRLRIHGDIVALMEDHLSTTLFIINWKTGEELHCCEFVDGSDELLSFAFLDDDYALVLAMSAAGGLALRLCRFRGNRAILCIFRFPDDRRCSRDPPFGPHALNSGAISPHAYALHNTAFLPVRRDVLVSIHHQPYGHDSAADSSYTLVHSSLLMQWALRVEESPSAPKPRTILPEEWISHTQVVKSPSLAIHGLKALSLDADGLQLFDFNSRSLRRELCGLRQIPQIENTRPESLSPSPRSQSLVPFRRTAVRSTISYIQDETEITFTEGALTFQSHSDHQLTFSVYKFEINPAG